MADQRCPECGTPLPQQLGQHAVTPSVGLVECPNCGANVTLDRPKSVSGSEPLTQTGPGSGDGEDYFAGEETVEGVMDEIEQKEEQ